MREAGEAPKPGDPDSKPFQLKEELNWLRLKRGKGRKGIPGRGNSMSKGLEAREHISFGKQSVMRRTEALAVCGKVVGEGPERRRERPDLGEKQAALQGWREALMGSQDTLLTRHTLLTRYTNPVWLNAPSLASMSSFVKPGRGGEPPSAQRDPGRSPPSLVPTREARQAHTHPQHLLVIDLSEDRACDLVGFQGHPV